jgi:hypothetical protein
MQTHIEVYISTICSQGINKVHNGKCIYLCNNHLLKLYYTQLFIGSNMIKRVSETCLRPRSGAHRQALGRSERLVPPPGPAL